MKMTMIVNNCYNSFVFNSIVDAMLGEGGDGWVWVKTKNYESVAKLLLEHTKQNFDRFKIRFKIQCSCDHCSVVPDDDYTQELIYICDNFPKDHDAKCFEYVFELE